MDVLKTMLPSPSIAYITTIKPSMANDDFEDKLGWKWNKGTAFTSKLEYELLSEESDRQINKRWQVIWKIKGPQRASLACGSWKFAKQYGTMEMTYYNRPFIPESGWLIVNIDGARQLKSGIAIAEGSVRDENGVWHSGFARNIRICSTADAKLWGIHDRLILARKMTTRRVILEPCSLATLDLVHGKSEMDYDSTVLRNVKRTIAGD
ncbi:hypothetical protein GOBAR_AA08683 [Gossypium barbadense]|uniref:RNase H type-1 domain-containing protein n=1 Tax=Gossypium barbadense TaxID=3634 RepID=A0A2P5Y8P9_GOSBA|nr:hypothetical protein GOBAR_AA08683 [Gossypium barbadense]